MENTQIINDIKSDIECEICYEKFIKLTNEQFDIFFKDNKHILSNTFEDDYCCRCYEDRFECSKCKHTICQKCYWNFKNHRIIPNEIDRRFFEYIDILEHDDMIHGCPGEDCPIICPFCKTNDYKIFYGNKIPYELLNQIKNKRCK